MKNQYQDTVTKYLATESQLTESQLGQKMTESIPIITSLPN